MNKENVVVKNQVILNSIQDLQRLSLQLVNSLRGRSRIKYGMTALCNNGGFTLIELLVVVLIIGILAAVALPQYKLAVVKSRVATMLPTLKAVAQANAVYFMANGAYSPSVYNLDVAMPGECTAVAGGSVAGQLWQCGNDFLVDNSGGYLLVLKYCPKKNDTYQNCSAVADFVITMYVEGAKVLDPTCSAAYGTSFGQKVCNSLALH